MVAQELQDIAVALAEAVLAIHRYLDGQVVKAHRVKVMRVVLEQLLRLLDILAVEEEVQGL
jgi:hypothetical protein